MASSSPDKIASCWPMPPSRWRRQRRWIRDRHPHLFNPQTRRRLCRPGTGARRNPERRRGGPLATPEPETRRRDTSRAGPDEISCDARHHRAARAEARLRESEEAAALPVPARRRCLGPESRTATCYSLAGSDASDEDDESSRTSARSSGWSIQRIGGVRERRAAYSGSSLTGESGCAQGGSLGTSGRAVPGRREPAVRWSDRRHALDLTDAKGERAAAERGTAPARFAGARRESGWTSRTARGYSRAVEMLVRRP